MGCIRIGGCCPGDDDGGNNPNPFGYLGWIVTNGGEVKKFNHVGETFFKVPNGGEFFGLVNHNFPPRGDSGAILHATGGFITIQNFTTTGLVAGEIIQMFPPGDFQGGVTPVPTSYFMLVLRGTDFESLLRRLIG